MPKFTVVVPVLNQHDVTERLMESWFALAKSRVSILFIDNGSEQPLAEQPFVERWASEHDVRVHRNEENIGVYPTFQQGMEMTDSEWVFFSHNDVEMLDWGWDERLETILFLLTKHHKPGVCGMFGAKGIGTPDIYRAPYEFTQLMRWHCHTVQAMHDGDPNASVPLERLWERIAVLDGFSIIVSRRMFNEALGGKFDHERYPVHHCYDQDICLDSHFGGFENYAIDVNCKHHGGVTSTREKWAEDMGSSDLKIHRAAHKVMYEKFRGRLPVGFQ